MLVYPLILCIFELLVGSIFGMFHVVYHKTLRTQNTKYRYLATKQIKHILTTNRHNTLHERYQYTINKLKRILQNHTLTIVKTDKRKAMMTI